MKGSNKRWCVIVEKGREKKNVMKDEEDARKKWCFLEETEVARGVNAI